MQDKTIIRKIKSTLEIIPGIFALSPIVENENEPITINIIDNKNIEISLGIIILNSIKAGNIGDIIFNTLKVSIKKQYNLNLTKINVFIKGVK